MVSAEKNTHACLDAIERHRHLNAFITVDAAGALETARQIDSAKIKQPLAGVVIAVKDNIHVKGLPNTAGTPALTTFIPTQDAPIITRLRAAGAIIIGKTNMHELAFGITSNNAHFGPVRNAVDSQYIAGGSSGGSAVAIATGMATVALGTDTAGSIRIPAALNGIYGLRPTFGRYPAEGIVPLVVDKDVAGPMARTIDDLALLDGIISSENGTDENTPLESFAFKNIRLGLPQSYFIDDLDPEVRIVFEEFLKKLKYAGVTLIPVDVGSLLETNEQIKQTIFANTPAAFKNYLTKYKSELSFNDLIQQIVSPDVKSRFQDIVLTQEAQPESLLQYHKAIQELRPRLQEQYKKLFTQKHLNALIFPTTPSAAIRIDQIREPETARRYLRNTDPAANAGLPGLSIPIGLTSQNLPVGAELDGLIHNDRSLLAIAKTLQPFGHSILAS